MFRRFEHPLRRTTVRWRAYSALDVKRVYCKRAASLGSLIHWPMIKFLINRFLLKEQNVNDVIHLINLPVRKDSPIPVVLVSNLVTRANLIETLNTANPPIPVFHWLSRASPRTKGWRIYPTYEQSVKNKLHLMTSPKGIGSKLPVNIR